MNYEQRLIAAAKCVYVYDSRLGDNPPLNPADFGVTATLKPHQIEGVAWLIKRYLIGANVILGDEMGLGKTLQAICFLSYLKYIQKSSGPFLIICPLSVTDGWVSEISNFAPNLRVLSYIGEKEHRRTLRNKIYQQVKDLPSSCDVKSLPFDILLTTYDMALIDQDFLSQFRWPFAVIDEAQRLKNPSSVLYNVLEERYLIPRILLMTGTPIQNNLTELWALMHFCMPQVFGTLELFLSYFKEAGDPSGHDASVVQKKLRSMKYLLGAFMLRRTKSKLIESGSLSLPPLTEITVMAPLVSLQRKVYVSILRKELPKLLAIASGSSNAQSLQNMVIQLRKACSHPYLFPGIEPEPYEEGEHLVEASGKLVILDKVLQKLHKSGHRVLLFSQMTHTLDILQDLLEWRKYSYERLDGSIRAEERFAAIRSFSHQPSARSMTSEAVHDSAFVFLISTRAGGVGLNLVAADTVIFYEQDWNPQVDKQALQRAHRMGQKNHVLSINLVTAQTVEEVIMRRAERKLLLSHNVIGDNMVDQEGNGMTGVEGGDLRSVVLGLHKFDTAEICNDKSDQMDMGVLDEMAENIVSFRDKTHVAKDGKRFELNSKGLLNEQHSVPAIGPGSVAYDPGLDEASYRSWVEKFKDESPSDSDVMLDVRNRKNVPQEKHLKVEAAKKKAEERKQSKWEALGYHSLSVGDPVVPPDSDIISDSGVVQFLYGDCTHPVTESPSEPVIIFSCIDNSGNWGGGGLFDALKSLSTVVPDAYERAHESGDLHLGDLHLIPITEDGDEGATGTPAKKWVALGVVQTFNNRRKVPRSDISMPHFDQCLAKASFAAAQNSASIHMPRVGYQDGSDRSQWYTVERLLRKYAAVYGIKVYVYYYRRPG